MITLDQQGGSTRHEVVRAGEADIDTLARVIAEAFFPLAVCRWLIPDGPARRAAFPGYFRLYVEHAIADGLVYTTRGRDAAALWIPGDGPSEPPEEYARRSGRTARARAPAPRCWMPATPTLSTRASRPTWRHRTSAPAACTSLTVTLTGAGLLN